jgi:hypothetical protein
MAAFCCACCDSFALPACLWKSRDISTGTAAFCLWQVRKAGLQRHERLRFSRSVLSLLTSTTASLHTRSCPLLSVPRLQLHRTLLCRVLPYSVICLVLSASYMLSRASSDAGTRLRRSKSSSTVYTARVPPIEYLDSDVAQQHAVAAAATAFARAHIGGVADRQKRSSELLRSKSSASRRSQGSHFPPRESSFRSIYPPGAAVSASDASRRSRASALATETYPQYYTTPNEGTTSSARAPASGNENARPSSQPKSHRPSASSSITSQRIRKARSMYYASSIQTGSPIARPPAKYLVTPPPISPALDDSRLSAPSIESASQRPRSSAVSPAGPHRLPVTIAPGETVDKARDKYLSTFQQRQIKQRPSLFLAPFRKRQDKPRDVTPPPFSDVSTHDKHHKLIHKRSGTPLDPAMNDFKSLKQKRSFSNSLRNKFKKVFRRTSRGAPTIPAQQTEATRDYYSEFALRVDTPSDRQDAMDIPSPHENVLHRVKARSPTLEGGRPAFARPSSRGSIRSLHSDVDTSNTTSSRVTSWSNSSAGNTSTQREIKRLTVIHEAKDSIGSDKGHTGISLSPKRTSAPTPGLAAFRDPMHMECLVEETLAPIDPKRVFSALMKEIDVTNPTNHSIKEHGRASDAEGDVFVTGASRQLHSSSGRGLGYASSKNLRPSTSSDAPRPISYLRPSSATTRSKGHSIKSGSMRSIGRAIRSTIRTVTPSMDKTSPSLDRVTSVRGKVLIPKPEISASSSPSDTDIDRHREIDKNNDMIDFRMPRRQTSRPDSSSMITFVPSQEQIESRVQKSQGRWKTPLEEGPDQRLSRPTESTSSLAESGRQTFSEEKHPPAHTQTANKIDVLAPTGVVAPASPVSPKPVSLLLPLSPSVYSRNTDGISIMHNDSMVSLRGADGDPGSAVIMTSAAVKSYVIGSPPPKNVSHSARSSKDWRAWLSHEVSELNYIPNEDLTIQTKYAAPARHRRELTEITDGDSLEARSGKSCSPQLTCNSSNRDEKFANRSISKDSEVFQTGSPNSLRLPKGSVEIATVQRVPSRPPFNAISSKAVLPTFISSNHSSLSRPKSRIQSSERMNERFPYILSGRCSSRNSARLSQHTPSITGSNSTSSKATSSPKMISMPSVTHSQRKSIPNSSIRSNRQASVVSGVGDGKENYTPSIGRKSFKSQPPTPETTGRPSSFQLKVIPTLNRTQSSLAQYTTSTGSTKELHPLSGQPSAASGTPRIRLRVRPVSPEKPTVRPRSAFDLRASYNPTSNSGYAKSLNDNSSPNHPTASSCTASTARLSQHSLRSTQYEAQRTPLHLRTSTSTLALSKEPTPSDDDLHIDALVEESDKENVNQGRGGSVTPGQRMAERFLRERTLGSGAGTPVSVISERGILDREDTPASL